MPDYPEVKVEVMVDYGLTDIVAERYDAGIRFGEQVAKDMVAVRIGPDMRIAVVGAPSYFARSRRPRTPQDLTAHACINLDCRLTAGSTLWEFEKRGRELKARVDGQLIFNNIALRLNAALAGFGMAYLPEDQVLQRVEAGGAIDPGAGRLVSAVPRLGGGSAVSGGGRNHLYYPSRQQATPAFSLLVDAVRYRDPSKPSAGR